MCINASYWYSLTSPTGCSGNSSYMLTYFLIVKVRFRCHLFMVYMMLDCLRIVKRWMAVNKSPVWLVILNWLMINKGVTKTRKESIGKVDWQ